MPAHRPQRAAFNAWLDLAGDLVAVGLDALTRRDVAMARVCLARAEEAVQMEKLRRLASGLEPAR